jgi:PAS domain S-box-containing protein
MDGGDAEDRLSFSGILKVLEWIEDYAIFLLDGEGRIVSWNKQAETTTGFTASEVIGKHLSALYAEEVVKGEAPEKKLLRGTYEERETLVRKDGSKFLVSIFIVPTNGGYIVAIKDLGKEGLDERKRRTERAFNVLSKTNRAITQAKDENELLERICRIMIYEGYMYAWIGYAMDDKSVRAVAKAGRDGYANMIRVTWDESETGLGPTGTAIREKRTVVAKDITKDSRFRPWREEAMKRGFASSIALPLVYGSTVFGALNVYASEKNAFDKEEIGLLQEVANNLGYAIAMLRSKRKEERTKEVMDLLWKLVTRDLGYKTFLRELLKEIIRITRSKYGFFGTLSEDERELVVHAWSEEVMDDCRISKFRFPVDKGGLWADAVRMRRKIIVNDYESYPDKKLPKGHVPLKRFLIVPVIKNRAVSLVGVANKSEEYGEEDAEILEFFMRNVQEILEKKRIEEMYKTLIENTGTAMLISDPETVIKFANKEAEKMLEMPREEIIGKCWTEFVFKDELGRLLEYAKLRDIDPSLAPETYETRIVDGRGKVKHILLNISPIPRSRDHIASFIDITELRKTQEMLKESEERYRTLFDKSRDGIILMGIDMKIIDCNNAALELLGLSKEEVLGKSFLELGIVSRDDFPLVMETFYKGLRERVETFELKVELRGETRWVEVSPTTLKKNRKPFAILNIIRDITERKKLETNLRMGLDRLKILHEVDKGIIEGKSFEEISKLALHRLRELLGFEAVGLFKYDKDKNEIVLECFDSDVEIFENGFKLAFKPRLSMDYLRRGEISYVNNLLDLERLTDFEKELLKGGIRAYVHVPLIVREELMGILCLAAKKPKAFDEKLQFIVEISDQLAIALHEAKLFEIRVRSLERLEKNIEEFAILVDHIRNPLAIITGTAELRIEDEKVKEVIYDAVKKIEDVVSRLDKGWLESEQIRDFLKRLHG